MKKFKNPFRPEDPELNEAITEAFKDLKGFHADEDEYQAVRKNLSELYALKQNPVALDPNKILLIVGNIYLGMKVLGFEESQVVTTKLWNFLSKI